MVGWRLRQDERGTADLVVRLMGRTRRRMHREAFWLRPAHEQQVVSRETKEVTSDA